MDIDNSNKTSVTTDEKSALDTLSECDPLFDKFDSLLYNSFGTKASSSTSPTPTQNDNKRKREELSPHDEPSPNDTTSLSAGEPAIQIDSQHLFPVADPDPDAVVDADATTSPIAAAPGVDVAPGVDKAADIDAHNGDPDTAVEGMMNDIPLGGDDAGDVPVAPQAEEHVEIIDLCDSDEEDVEASQMQVEEEDVEEEDVSDSDDEEEDFSDSDYSDDSSDSEDGES